jgi:hypothetical protein
MNTGALRRRWLLTFLQTVIFPFLIAAAPPYPDIRESLEIGPKGGSIMAEDPESGLSVGISIPEGALLAKTTITILLHGTKQPGVLARTHINGVSVLPKDLLLLEKARLEIYNPSVDAAKGMVLYRVVNDQFIIPLGSNEINEDENWIGGTFYITGRFSLGTPSAAEASAQSKKLAAYNPVRPLAYSDEDPDIQVQLFAENNFNEFQGQGGPSVETPSNFLPFPAYPSADDEECMRWQKALTKVEAHMTWIEHYIYMNNPSAEQAERNKARDALQEAIDGYLKKASPSERCGSYIRAAAKYLEAATLLGMNLGDESPIAQKFNQLVDECSFVFTVETYEWLNHPREIDLGGMFEEKSDWYGTIKCHIPWNEFIATGNQTIKGEGNMNLHYETHWVGDEKESHEIHDGTWKADKIEGAVTVSEDGYGQLSREAHIRIYWTNRVKTHIWGKDANGSYDKTGTDSKSYEESKVYPLENGYEEKIGNESGGMSFKVIILKQPGDGRDDPNDCF